MDSQTANEQAAGAPGVVRLGDADYLCAPATDASLVAAYNFVRERLKSRRQTVANLWATLPPEQAKAIAALPAELRGEAVKSIVAAEVERDREQDAADVILSLDGCRFIAWLHLKPPLNPDLTRERLHTLITEDNYADVFLDLDRATGVTALIQRKAGDQGNPSGRRS